MNKANTKWLAKSEILKDLGLVGVAGSPSIHTVGDKPPAYILEEDSDEHSLRNNYGSSSNYEVVTPDLHNISRMLNMVNNFERTSHFREPERCLNDNVLVISKLNPNVSEFRPINNNANASNNNTMPNESKKITDTPETSILENNDKQNKLNEIEEKANLLKQQIVENSKSNKMKTKTAKNVAMAALLKLYSDPRTPTQSNVKEDGTYKLLTPDDFRLTKEKIETPEIPKPVTPSITKDNVKQDLGVSAKEIEMSIKKVDNWLIGPELGFPKPYLSVGPIKYKSPAATVTPESSKPVSPVTTPSVKKFVSTNTELYNKLCEDSKKVQLAKQSNENIWEKATRLMKEKEAKAKTGEVQYRDSKK